MGLVDDSDRVVVCGGKGNCGVNGRSDSGDGFRGGTVVLRGGKMTASVAAGTAGKE